MFGIIFQIYNIQITGKYIFKSKKIKVGIFDNAPPAKISHHYPFSPSRGKLLISPRQYFFFQKFILPAEKGTGKETVLRSEFFKGFSLVLKLSNFLIFIPMDSLKRFFLSLNIDGSLFASFNFENFYQYFLFFCCCYSLFLSFYASLFSIVLSFFLKLFDRFVLAKTFLQVVVLQYHVLDFCCLTG